MARCSNFTSRSRVSRRPFSRRTLHSHRTESPDSGASEYERLTLRNEQRERFTKMRIPRWIHLGVRDASLDHDTGRDRHAIAKLTKFPESIQNSWGVVCT